MPHDKSAFGGLMSTKPSDSGAHPYEPEPYPLLKAWPEFWWMNELDPGERRRGADAKAARSRLLASASDEFEHSR